MKAEDPLHCPVCWNTLPPDALRCPHCGKVLSSDELARQRELEDEIDIERRRKGGCLGVLVVAALLAGFFGLIRMFFMPRYF